MLVAARKRAIEVVPIALQRITDFFADPNQHQDVGAKIRCYFKLARNAHIQQVKSMFERIQQLIPSSRHVCAGDREVTVTTPDGIGTVKCSGGVAMTFTYRDDKD